MKIQKILLVVLLGATIYSATGFAATSANVGYLSDYYYRGIELGESSAYVGADFESQGFNAGVWVVDDGAAGSGLETDFYLGYTWKNDNFSLGVAYTLYEYTYTSDAESEVNLSLSAGAFSLDAALGNDDDDMIGDEDYTFVSVSLSGDVFGLTYGSYDDEDELLSIANNAYDYVEVSASGEIADLSVSVTIGESSSSDSGPNNEGYLFIDISKSFDL